MAALNAAARAEVAARLAEVVAAAGAVGLTKPDLIAAAGGIDDYIDANAAAIKQSIPQPARGLLTNAQIAALVSIVALRRYGG